MSNASHQAPVRLAESFHNKVWGSPALSPWFPAHDGGTVGEVWLTHQPPLPLLFKFLFTTERLSIQVHPGDDYADQHESSRGKTEMWHILRAAPGAEIALGFRHAVTREQAVQAAQDGSILELLNWVPVQAGENYFVPAGTVHAIGAGIALCEIQQQSDVTYRLYDYGRPRELHLEKGFAVSDFGPYDGRRSKVRCPYFATEEIAFTGRLSLRTGAELTALLMLEGEGVIDGARFRQGQGWLLPLDGQVVLEASTPVRLLQVIEP
ncbi:MAG: class I mannose-6-phosphate isomerase [Bryobacteraceae bacterium]|nr:class I mannose-6-phosphate isomerase [Bryobacteraceae bacterium]